MSAALGAGGGGGFLPPRRPRGSRNGYRASLSRGQLVRRAASAAAASSSYFERVKGWSGPLKAAVTSGSLCAVGDVLAQSIAGWYATRDAADATAADPKAKKKKGGGGGGPSSSSSSSSAPPYDACRTLRMAGFGLLFYGPYQYYWYSLLEHAMPQRTVANFVSKVAANQLLLAPVTLTVAFAWHLVFSKAAAGSASAAGSGSAAASGSGGKKNGNKKGGAAAAPSTPTVNNNNPLAALSHRLSPLPDKLRRDFVPALLTGWKFWVPAASVNFCAVPLRHQVLYMSCCGVLWTAYLSHASGNSVGGGKEVVAAGGAKRR